MSMFNSYWKCNYDELITYYPRYYREVLEMDAILRAEGKLADDLQDSIDLMLLNNFIDGADVDTISRFERFIGLSLLKKRSLEERRRFVKSFFSGMGKVSATRITETIRAYTGAETVCDFYPFDEEKNNRLDIMFLRGSEETIYISDIHTLLERMLPAHIEWRAMVVYRFGIGIGCRREHYKYLYEFCGTKPYSILIADVNGVTTVVEAHITDVKADYKHSAKDGVMQRSGQHPNTALLAGVRTAETVVEADITNDVETYKFSGSGKVGKHPNTTTLAEERGADVGIGAENENTIIMYKRTGVEPDTATIVQESEVSVGVGEKTEHNIMGYKSSGVIPDTATIAHETEITVGVGEKTEHTVMEHKSSGVKPDTASIAHNDEINAAVEVKSYDYGVNYIPCGTKFTR